MAGSLIRQRNGSEQTLFRLGVQTWAYHRMSNPNNSRIVTVANPQGLHARPAHLIVAVAQRFQAQIRIIRNGEAADGTSIMSLLTLAAGQGDELRLEATGEDASRALDAIEELFRDGFDDDDEHLEQGTRADGGREDGNN
jgi:phosphocarrier protein